MLQWGKPTRARVSLLDRHQSCYEIICTGSLRYLNMACFVFGYRILSLNLTSQKNFQDIKVIKYMEIIITLLRFIPYVIFLQDKKEESPV